jgi:DnaJ-class molecular chaperone
VLSDPERRRSYEAEFEKQRQFWPRDRSSGTSPAGIDDEFPASSPFLDAEYDTPWAFFSQRIGRSRRPRRITAEAVLTPREAESGCRVPFSLPCLVLCGRCGGCGEWRPDHDSAQYPKRRLAGSGRSDAYRPTAMPSVGPSQRIAVIPVRPA